MAASPVRRWLATMSVAALVAAVCVAAGVWQWTRHTDRSAVIDLLETNYDAEPVPVGELVEPAEAVPAEHVWRQVRAVGRYLEGSEVLLRNRPVGRTPGFHVLAPFRIEQGDLAGAVLVVDRGWVPAGDDLSEAGSVPPLPSGTVELVVNLRADEPPASRDAPAGQVHRISVEQVKRASAATDWPDGATLAAYGALRTEDGATPDGLGGLARPSTDPGSHLSYAFQWWVFALGALVGAVVLMRREGTDPDGGADRSGARPTPARRRPTAEEEEDALLDAQQVP